MQNAYQPTNLPTSETPENSDEPARETYPWEAEFNEEDYVITKYNVGDKITYYREGSVFGIVRREIYEWMDGAVSDSYYYPDGTLSHDYWQFANGDWQENHYLNNGYVDVQNQTVVQGTRIYTKTIKPDGTEYETFCDDNGEESRSIGRYPDGGYYDYDAKTGITTGGNVNTGEYYEQESFENGNVKRTYSYDPATETHFESEYFENGAQKYNRNQSPDYTIEQAYDEEGYCTYFYNKSAEYEIECISDETGKLVKLIENGTVYEEEAALAQYASGYNFRG